MDGIRTHEDTLYRLAHQGDEDAKRELEVRDFTRQANDRTFELRDKAVKGDKAALDELKLRGKGTPAASTPAAKSSSASPAEVVLARSASTNAERARWVAVYASEHSKGRERCCATLLGADKGWSAAEIIKQLPELPTDREHAAKSSQAISDAVWERALVAGRSPRAQQILDAQRGYREPSAKAKRILDAQKKAGTRSQQEISDDRWARAYAREGR